MTLPAEELALRTPYKAPRALSVDDGRASHHRMNPVSELVPYLKQLRLSGIRDSLEARSRQALDSKLAYTELLALLIEDEVARREHKKFALRLRRAAFRTSKTLDQFDVERLPQLNQAGPAVVPTAGPAAADAGAATQAQVPASWARPVGETRARAMEYGLRPR